MNQNQKQKLLSRLCLTTMLKKPIPCIHICKNTLSRYTMSLFKYITLMCTILKLHHMDIRHHCIMLKLQSIM